MWLSEVVCERRPDRHRLAVVDDVFRIERLNAKERRLMVLRKPAQNDDEDRVDGGAGEGCMHGDGGLDDGRVVGVERRDDGVELVGAVVFRPVLPSWWEK